jgi:hypothetical protein
MLDFFFNPMKFQYESTAFRPRFQNCVTTSRSEYHNLYHLCVIIFKKKAWTKAISLVFKKEKKRKGEKRLDSRG